MLYEHVTKPALTHFRPVFDLCRKTRKMFKKHLWKSDISSKDAGRRKLRNKKQSN